LNHEFWQVIARQAIELESCWHPL